MISINFTFIEIKPPKNFLSHFLVFSSRIFLDFL